MNVKLRLPDSLLSLRFADDVVCVFLLDEMPQL